MKIYHNIFIFLLIILMGFVAKPVFAAQVFFENSNHEFVQGQEFLIPFYLDAGDDSLNAIEGSIIFPDNLLQLKEIKDGNSIINFWIEKPNLQKSNEISFSGIVPGGYHGPKGLIFSLIFEAKDIGTGSIEINKTNILKNDGKGTPLKTKTSPFLFSVVKSTSLDVPKILPPEDKQPPEDFKPEISQSPDLFDGKWFLVFSTQDKESGIDHYEIMEAGQWNSFEKLFTRKDWEAQQSPYLLKDQTLKSDIFIKAIDKSNNERIVKIKAKNGVTWYENYIIWIILMVLMVLSIIGIKKIWKRKYA